ncbi:MULTISPECIES: type II toxin-antitoxin system VapC family toxin [unclassified Mesorhizobium]|uniref:type II toxin-antitoxin system VapC family toxin n=1 Tax=unclassified Mesorhizobium TaxID=325217 RepID=UPI00112D80E6|nr:MULTISPECIES: type II toxin-antitoxin system VapC family toxin [unclassified Mesorhizobium]MBZ9740024.1 type II toxin-antitoxin system VapC family toxin [Mesorhizobium sp. CO1-1-4]MBZ9803309.1 type II toxin-antitoxin system VapC family toxin [Mesorhizobium sp. ES1-6]MBZ9996531.1 type II toxin-antitoxin system VapC family toxin [Mesorhizobium sp. BH1-1-4]TPL92344.1 type II toxin-antitoxin system VapC family toxin [Mesorhizobium sp. B2-3-12]
MSEEPGLLLDTCAVIFIANDSKIDPQASQQISDAAYDGRLYLSPMSAWEIGIGVAKGRLNLPIAPLDFVERFIERMSAKLCAISPAILIASSNLPGSPHGDPMDRILIATARALDMVLVTRDEPILRYSRNGHLRALAC